MRPSLRYGMLVLGVLMIGILLGTGIGFWLSPNSPGPQTSARVSMDPASRQGEQGSDPMTVPSVTVGGSEAARRLYEENLAAQPEAYRPDPDAAPAATRPVPKTVVPQSEPPPEVPLIAALPAVPIIPSADPDTWLKHAVPVALEPGKPMIALVFDDLGIDQARSRRALELPGPMTMAFLTYGYHLRELVASARAGGHEILVHVPMAPIDLGVDPGPNALQRELGAAEILRRLDWGLSQFDGYVGINNHMGSRFTADAEGMALVMAELKHRGLIFIDSITNKDSKGHGQAARMQVPYAVRDIFLDHSVDRDDIRRQLRRVEETALRQGYAIAIGHPHDETLDVIRTWLETAEERGFQLVPVSAIVRLHQANPRS